MTFSHMSMESTFFSSHCIFLSLYFFCVFFYPWFRVLNSEYFFFWLSFHLTNYLSGCVSFAVIYVFRCLGIFLSHISASHSWCHVLLYCLVTFYPVQNIHKTNLGLRIISSSRGNFVWYFPEAGGLMILGLLSPSSRLVVPWPPKMIWS